MSQEIKAQGKRAVKEGGEPTKAGPVFLPAVDIYESPECMTLVADMPGVNKQGLTIDLKEDTLTIRGSVASEEGEGLRLLYREYEEGDYYRQFSLSELIDQAGITATLKDGVLTLVLPKVAPAEPRKIEVKVE